MPVAAAFFDLDRTLMAGSSGMHFGRAAYRSGMVSRRQMAALGGRPPALPAQGLDRRRHRGARAPGRGAARRRPRARGLKRMVPDLLAGILPRIYPQMIDEVRAHQDAGRPTFIVSAAGDEIVRAARRRARHGRRDRHPLRGRRRGQLHRADSTAASPTARARSPPMRRFADEHGIDLDAVLGLLGLGLRPADAAAGRQPGRRQPGRRAGAVAERGGLAGDAVREARPPPRGGRHRARRRRDRRQRHLARGAAPADDRSSGAPGRR